MRYNERHIFPGANTPQGFFSYYDNITDKANARRFFCLKGGPGVGKSSYMKRIAEELMKQGVRTELFHCSSDPHSLDGVRFPEYEIALVDGTAPHVIDPCYPGAVDEIINLGDFWDARQIREHRQEIVETQHNISYEYSRAYKYLSAAVYVSDDTDLIYNSATDHDGIEKLAADLCEMVFTQHSEGETKRIRKLFASALTPAGLVNYSDTVLYDCKRVYGLVTGENIGSLLCADTVMNTVAAQCYKHGYACELFYCPMKPNTRIEHIVIPELETGFTVLNKYNNDETVATEIINLQEYICRAAVRENADKLADNDRMYSALLNNAQDSLKNAYWLHNTLESYYVPYVRFDEVNEHCRGTLEKILTIINDAGN